MLRSILWPILSLFSHWLRLQQGTYTSTKMQKGRFWGGMQEEGAFVFWLESAAAVCNVSKPSRKLACSFDSAALRVIWQSTMHRTCNKHRTHCAGVHSRAFNMQFHQQNVYIFLSISVEEKDISVAMAFVPQRKIPEWAHIGRATCRPTFENLTLLVRNLLSRRWSPQGVGARIATDVLNLLRLTMFSHSSAP